MDLAAESDIQISRTDPSSMLPPVSYEPGTKIWYTADGCIGFGFISHPIVNAGYNTADKVATMLQQDWPENTIMSICLWASPDIELYLARVLACRYPTNFGGRSELEEMIRDKVEFFRGATTRRMNQGMYSPLRDFNLFITVKIPLEGGGLPTDADYALAVERRSATERSLEGIGLAPQAINADVYMHHVSTMLNWGEHASWKLSGSALYDHTRLVNEQVCDFDTQIRVDSEGLWLGKKRVRVLSPKTYPDWCALPNMVRLIGDPLRGKEGISGNFMVTMNLQFLDNIKSRDAISAQKALIDFQANGRLGSTIASLRSRQADFATFMSGLEGGARPIKIQHTFVTFSDDDASATKSVAAMQSFYRDLQLTVQPDQYIVVPLFFGALPFGADPDPKHVRFLRRYRTAETALASELVPIQADWKGTDHAVLSYISRNGQPIGLDLFDSNGNFNWLICAASGAGKSFFANDLITSYMSIGARIYVIDVGRSYEKICETLDGEFMSYGSSSDICMNPFPLVMKYDDEADMLASMIKCMASPTGRIDEWSAATIDRVLRESWEELGPSMMVDDVAKRLCSHPDRRAKDLGEQLYNFTSAGTYGRWFNGENNVQFDNQLTVLELEELNSKKNLQSVVLLQLLYQITQTLYLPGRATTERTIIIIDEAWALLTQPLVAEFMVTAYRRARKANGSMGMITQSINDLWSNEKVGMAILENSQWWFLLAQKPESIARIKANKLLTLSDGGFALLESVHRDGGNYSEVMIYTNTPQGPVSAVARLVVTRYAALLYTTDPAEKNMIATLRARGYSLREAISHIIEQERAQ